MRSVSKILVIEDEPDQNRLIRLRLEARGYRVISVGKAREGIELAASEKPALILMDMILPDMHGLDATIKLKQNEETRATPVIGISAVGSPDFIKTCLQEGMAAYVRKPYDPRELFKTIEKFAGPAAPRQKPAKSPPAAAPGISHKLNEIEDEFKKKTAGPGTGKTPPSKARPAEEQAIDELIEGVLGGLPDLKKGPAEAPPPVKTQASPRRAPSHILIVDDDAVFIRAVTGHLTERGYEISLAIDGIRGLRQAFQNKPDLILLNLILPAGSGEEVVANLRKAPETRGIPVFIMSGLLSAKMLEEKVRELGVQGFISKPVEPEDLLYIIESVVGG
jgi:CheY-like chemotaxis protein